MFNQYNLDIIKCLLNLATTMKRIIKNQTLKIIELKCYNI